jgi:hypothetical protein
VSYISSVKRFLIYYATADRKTTTECYLLGSKSAILLQNLGFYSVAQSLGMTQETRWEKDEVGI